jgi:5-methylcytosine-specific restriction endonuclease McrA
MDNCFYCGIETVIQKQIKHVPDPPNLRTRDHWVPRSKQGAEGLIVIACNRCNNEKGSLTGPEYLAVLRYRARHQFFAGLKTLIACTMIEIMVLVRRYY